MNSEEIYADVPSVLAGALKFEEFGRDFYRTLAMGMQDVQANSLFRYLAAEEEYHIEDLLEMKKSQGIEDAKELDFGPVDTFFDAADELDINDPVSVLEYSVKLEEASVQLYERGSNIAENNEVGIFFQKLVDFEKDHLGKLDAALREFKNRP